jgi:hypothetical protein
MTESDFANKNSSIHHDIHHSPSGDEHTDEGDPHPTHPTHEDHTQHHETEATRDKEKVMKMTNLKKVAGLILTVLAGLFFVAPPASGSANPPRYDNDPGERPSFATPAPSFIAPLPGAGGVVTPAGFASVPSNLWDPPLFVIGPDGTSPFVFQSNTPVIALQPTYPGFKPDKAGSSSRPQISPTIASGVPVYDCGAAPIMEPPTVPGEPSTPIPPVTYPGIDWDGSNPQGSPF